MIIYFTGTGNSLAVAQRLASEGEQVLSLAELIKNKRYTIELEEGEALGMVFPVYFYTLPSIVKAYLEKVEFRNADYVYSVITCGGGTGQASAVLQSLLQKKGMSLSYFQELLMPDNGMLFYQIPTVEESADLLAESMRKVEAIRSDIAERKTTTIGSNTMLASVLGLGYKMCSGTKKYRAEPSCIGCGLCARNCPEDVIQMVDGRPKWTKKHCCKCSACINKCPVRAIQYGKRTEKRNRYSNPLV